jgi:ABC-type transporter Mla subunit MlaD
MMSKDNLQIIERKTIEQLVNELDFLNAQIFAKIKNDVDGGLITSLQNVITTADLSQTNLDKTVTSAKIVKNEIEKAQKNIEDNVEILNQILTQCKDFESKNEQMLEFQTQKIENLKEKIELKSTIISEQFEQDLKDLKSKLLADVDTQIQKINEEINSKLKGVDLRMLDGSNRLVSNSLSQLTLFQNQIAKIERKNTILFTLLSFISGGALASLLFYFIF